MATSARIRVVVGALVGVSLAVLPQVGAVAATPPPPQDNSTSGLLPAGARVERPLTFTARTTVLDGGARDALTSYGSDGRLVFTGVPASLARVRAGQVLVSEPTAAAPAGLMRRVVSVLHTADGLVVRTAPAALGEAVRDGKFSYQGHPVVSSAALQAPGSPGVTVTGVRPDAPALPQELTVGLKDYVLWDADGKASTSDDQTRANGTVTFALPAITFDFDMQSGKLSSLLLKANFSKLAANLVVAGLVPTKGISSETVPYSLSLPAVPVGVFSFTPVVDVVVGFNGSVKPRAFFGKDTVDMSWGSQLTLISADSPATVGVQYSGGLDVQPIVELPTPTFAWTPVQLNGTETTKSAQVLAYAGVRPKVFIYGVAGPYVTLAPETGVEVSRTDPATGTTPFSIRAGMRVGGGISVLILNETHLGSDFNLTVPVYNGAGVAGTTAP